MSGQNILIGLVIAFLVFAVYSYSKTKSFSLDGMTSSSSVGITGSGEPSLRNSAAQNYVNPMMGSSFSSPPSPSPSEESSFASSFASPSTSSSAPSGYASKAVTNPSDLLPSDGKSGWGKLNPNSDTNQVIMPDLLEAGYHIGLDTIGQTLKLPNLQVRSEPIIPKQNVSPWNNSSFEPDIARVPLEIGYGCN